MKNYLFAALLLFSTAAFATNNNGGDEGCRGNCGSTTQPVRQDQEQGQQQGQHQGQAQQANASASAGASNTTVVGVGVGVDTRDTNINNNADYNANNNTAYGGTGGRGGEGGDGGTGVGFGGNQAQQQGIQNSGNSTARGGDQSQTATGGSVAGSGNSANSNTLSGNNSDQNTSVNFEAAEIPKHTPSMTAPNIYSSNACTLSGGIGLAGPGFGASVGGSKVDRGCEIREQVRILAGIDSALAVEYACRHPELDYGTVLGALCHANPGTPDPEPPIVIEPEPETPTPDVPVIVNDIKG